MRMWSSAIPVRKMPAFPVKCGCGHPQSQLVPYFSLHFHKIRVKSSSSFFFEQSEKSPRHPVTPSPRHPVFSQIAKNHIRVNSCKAFSSFYITFFVFKKNLPVTPSPRHPVTPSLSRKAKNLPVTPSPRLPVFEPQGEKSPPHLLTNI